jgi:hypothetical protein
VELNELAATTLWLHMAALFHGPTYQKRGLFVYFTDDFEEQP